MEGGKRDFREDKELNFWYGTKENMGLKEQMVREEIKNRNRGQSRMMENLK